MGERERLRVAVTQEEGVRDKDRVADTVGDALGVRDVEREVVRVAEVDSEGDTLALREALGELESVVEGESVGEREGVGDWVGGVEAVKDCVPLEVEEKDKEEVRHWVRVGEELGSRDAVPRPLRL